jgi:hypothetical protein
VGRLAGVRLTGCSTIDGMTFCKKVFSSHITMWEFVCKTASFLYENRLIYSLSKDGAMSDFCQTSDPSALSSEGETLAIMWYFDI